MRRGDGARWAAAGLAAACLAAAGPLATGCSPERRPAPAPPGVDQYLTRAFAAERAGDYDSCFTVYRAGIAEHPGDPRLPGFFGIAINNGSFDVTSSRGHLRSRLPTSLDRVRGALEAIHEFDLAELLAPHAPLPPLYRGRLYAAWGLPEDALREFGHARERGDASADGDDLVAVIHQLDATLPPAAAPAARRNHR